MKLVLTLLVRDEADVLDANLAFHLNAGVDFVIATDHGSQDGTTEILERYAREGYVHLLRERSEDFRQADWVTRMARLAASDFGADWVINADADEFWWPRGGSPKEILAAVPRRYGVVRGFQRHFAPRPGGKGHFAERLTVRITPYRPRTGPDDPFHGTIQVAHRGDPAVRVRAGNHDVQGRGLVAVRGWYPFEVLHFPLRTVEQARRKVRGKVAGRQSTLDVLGKHTLTAARAIEGGSFEQWYETYVVDDKALARGVADGTLVVDTRLRDTLRLLAGVAELPAPAASVSARPGDGPGLEFPRGDLAAEASYAHEMQELDAWDSQLRLLSRIARLEGRLTSLERKRPRRVRMPRLPSPRPAR
jgi:hypothetical protein